MFKMIYNIARTELQMLFYSPVAWLILVVFGVQSGMLFADQLAQLVSSQEMGYTVSFVVLFSDYEYPDYRGKIFLYDDLRSYHDRNLVFDHSL